MAKENLALLVQVGRVMVREKLQSVLSDVLQVMPEDAVLLRFTIKPLDISEEISAVIDRMSSVAATNECNGRVGIPVKSHVEEG